MKNCEYCNSLARDGQLRCESCGAPFEKGHESVFKPQGLVLEDARVTIDGNRVHVEVKPHRMIRKPLYAIGSNEPIKYIEVPE